MSGHEINQQPSSSEATIGKAAQPTEQQVALSRDNQPGGQNQQNLDTVKAQTEALVAGGTLPQVQIEGLEGSNSNSKSGTTVTPEASGNSLARPEGVGSPAQGVQIEGTGKAGTTPGDGTTAAGTASIEGPGKAATTPGDGTVVAGTTPIEGPGKAATTPGDGTVVADTTPIEGPGKAGTTPNDGSATAGSAPTDGTTAQSSALVDNGKPLTPDQVKAEAQTLEPMIQQFMNSNDYNTQKAAIDSYQTEVSNLATHGAASTAQVFSQVASDIKSGSGVNARTTANFYTDGSPSLDVTNNKLLPGQDLTTELSSDVTSNGVFTRGVDGNMASFTLNTAMANGKPGATNEKDSPPPLRAPANGGYSGAADYSAGSQYSAPASAPQSDSTPYQAQVYGADGSFQGVETVQRIN